MALRCGVNPFRGRVIDEAEATNAVAAFDLAVELATRKAKRIIRRFVNGLQCPTGQGCSLLRYDSDSVRIDVRRLFGEPSRRLRGYYRIVVEAKYRFSVACIPDPEDVIIVEPPDDEEDIGSEPEPDEEENGQEEEEHEEETEEPHCPDPDPPVIHTEGEQIGESKWFEIAPGGSLTSNPDFEQWHDAGPSAALDAWLAEANCPEGCEAYWDPEPEWRLRSVDTATGARCRFVLTNTITAKCRPE